MEKSPKMLVMSDYIATRFSFQTALYLLVKQKEKNILPLVTAYNPATPNLEKIFMKHALAPYIRQPFPWSNFS